MAMKQTQTKMFDFADVGLDFCPGSKNLFPDRFKKMLSQGYNEQTVASVSVTGNQVTLNYGVAHGYAADRVLKINSGPLVAINGGEFWIDAVTATSVTMSIDAAPISIAGGFVTKIAPLGWQLVYDVANVHIFKLKNLDETDLFLRLCYQNNTSYRSAISPCVGKTVDLVTGTITDSESVVANASLLTPARGLLWNFSQSANNIHNDWTYAQGYSTYGNSKVVGSIYHINLMFFCGNGDYLSRFYALQPVACFDLEPLKRPLLLGDVPPTNINNTGYNGGQDGYAAGANSSQAYIGKIPVSFDASNAPVTTKYLFYSNPQALRSYLSNSVEAFNTTTARPLTIFEKETSQFLGHAIGLYVCGYEATLSSKPAITKENLPVLASDIEQNKNLLLHCITANSSTSPIFLASPIEEIKIV